MESYSNELSVLFLSWNRRFTPVDEKPKGLARIFGSFFKEPSRRNIYMTSNRRFKLTYLKKLKVHRDKGKPKFVYKFFIKKIRYKLKGYLFFEILGRHTRIWPYI